MHTYTTVLYGGFIMNAEQTKVQKCSATQRGRMVIHKDNTEKRIYPNELDDYLADGWEIGTSESHRKSNGAAHKGKLMGNQNGFKKGNSPWNAGTAGTGVCKGWNKGLTKETDPRVAKIANSQSGKPGHRKGQHNSAEHNKKIGDANRGQKRGKLSPEKLEIYLTKQYATKKLNNSFNTSKPEEQLYETLLNDYLNQGKTVLRRYKEDRYPYYCDFYIPEDDLFIELNAHWTHGGHPFDEGNPEDLKTLELWKEKAKTSDFYKQAIDTWTVRDVEKLKCAKEHSLNYKTIY